MTMAEEKRHEQIIKKMDEQTRALGRIADVLEKIHMTAIRASTK